MLIENNRVVIKSKNGGEASFPLRFFEIVQDAVVVHDLEEDFNEAAKGNNNEGR